MRRLLGLILIAGLLLTPGVTSRVQAQDGAKHVVASGENLYRIALKYGISVDALASANGITDASKIYVGQVLVIPGAGSAAPAAPAQPAPAAVAANTGSGGYYTVQAGDNLGRIAARYNLTLTTLMRVNNITNANRIYVGQQLFVPGASGLPASPSRSASAPAASAGDRTHVVARGEGLGRIAQKYGLTWQQLAAYNALPNPDLIYVGMVLKVPPAGSAPSAAVVSAPAAPVGTGKLVYVKLSEQRVYLYENGKLLRSVLVSTGLPATPTVTGNYSIYVKYSAQTMSGPGYYLPNVPYVMYFYQGYGLHGTYWHSNWGRPMSHGCVNMPTEEAAWLYAWAEVGTAVQVRW